MLPFDPYTSFFFIAGPCLIEGEHMLNRTAKSLANSSSRIGAPVILKSSFRKANRTSKDGFIGIGDEKALQLLAAAGRTYGMPTLTDVHSEDDCVLAASYVDVLQIPAFLCRQTELIQAAARTGKTVNIKKGQFVAPQDMCHAVDKVLATGNKNVMLCERGTMFGYHNLVVDMRGLILMRECGVPVVYDATHSVQLPSGAGGVSGGQPQFIVPLARAAIAVGVNGVFFETHPDPSNAKSDAETQLPLDRAEEFMRECLHVHQSTQQIQAQ